MVATGDRAWPRSERLDPFRDAVWDLSIDGESVAYLTCSVGPMRSFPLFWVRQEWLWCQVNWLDGRRDPPMEDYGLGWYVVAELERGRLEYDGATPVVFDARRVEEPLRYLLWEQYGPPQFGPPA